MVGITTEKRENMAICKYCGEQYIEERFELGFEYCLAQKCQKLGIKQADMDFKNQYTPALLHKSNYFWVKKTELASVNVRSDLDSFGM